VSRLSEQIEVALVAERRIWREEYGIGGNSTDPMALCWESPADWPSDVPDAPRCNRRAGHAGNHICHVVWSAQCLTSEPEGMAVK